MNDGYAWWLVILGIAVGIALAWLVSGRLPRREDDVSAAEQEDEAVWISRTIESQGGIAPVPLVDEILDLHHSYLDSGGPAPARTAPVPPPDHVRRESVQPGPGWQPRPNPPVQRAPGQPDASEPADRPFTTSRST
jgi:hypothetical protein